MCPLTGNIFHLRMAKKHLTEAMWVQILILETPITEISNSSTKTANKVICSSCCNEKCQDFAYINGEIIFSSASSLPLTGEWQKQGWRVEIAMWECEATLRGLSDPCLYALVTTAGKPQCAALTT